MAKVIKDGVESSKQALKELNEIGINLSKVPQISIVGQAAIMMTSLLAGVKNEYIDHDAHGNPFVVIKGVRYSLAAAVFYTDTHGTTWIDSMVRNNMELQNDTGLKKYDLVLASVGFGFPSAPFKSSCKDNKIKVLKGFVGKFLATEQSDGSNDKVDIVMPIYCYLSETKPEGAIKILDVIEEESTSKMVAAVASIKAYLEKS
jgi:hypothetical protein